MAYLEADRVNIRKYLGFGAIFLQADPRLEAAITATQSVADQGARPDSSTENYIKGLIYGSSAVATVLPSPGPIAQNQQFSQGATIGLLGIDQQLQQLWGFTFATTAGNGQARVDTWRGMVQLRAEGKRLAFTLARALGMRAVRADVFSAQGGMGDSVEPFWGNDSQVW